MYLNQAHSLLLLLFLTVPLTAQQVPDMKYQPAIPSPAYAEGKGPRVGVDEAHHNFHTAEGRYQPFAQLLRRDGYRVEKFAKPFSAESLKAVDVLVIANPLNERNKSNWSLPTPSAFTAEEIQTVHQWVEQGGSLFLIADHMPFPGAASDFAKSFGITFSNGYARDGRWKTNTGHLFTSKDGLKENVITRGRNDKEAINSIATFGGSAFQLPAKGIPVLQFGPGSISQETTKAPGITPNAPKVDVNGWCQGGILSMGKGRIAIFGEAAMFSAQRTGANQQNLMGMNHPDAVQNHQLLLNVMHWLTRVEGMRE